MKIFVICELTYNSEYSYDEYSEPLIAFKSEEQADAWVKENSNKPDLYKSYTIEEIDLK